MRPPRHIIPIVLLGLLALTGCAPEPSAAPSPVASTSQPAAADVAGRLAALQEREDVSVGVTVIREDGDVLAFQGDQRFGYASTLKAFAAAALLATATPQERETVVTWTQDDVDAAGYSPVTSAHVADGLTLDALAEAAVRASDNTAMNLVMDAVGGPEGVQRFLRGLGDDQTMVSAREPDLNTVVPGDPAHTTTPAASAAALREVLTGDALRPEAAQTLRQWMSGNTTGDALIRAGAPSGWTVADKSGGAGGIRNDIAEVETPRGERLHLVIFTATDDPAAGYDDAVLAEAARIVLSAVAESTD